MTYLHFRLMQYTNPCSQHVMSIESTTMRGRPQVRRTSLVRGRPQVRRTSLVRGRPQVRKTSLVRAFRGRSQITGRAGKFIMQTPRKNGPQARGRLNKRGKSQLTGKVGVRGMSQPRGRRQETGGRLQERMSVGHSKRPTDVG